MSPTPVVLAMTGHRPDKLGGYHTPNPIYEAVVQGIYESFLDLRPNYVITGMALGVDQWAAELCVAMEIPFIAAVPFEGQEGKWPPRSKAKYHWLLTQAYQVYTICPGGYSPQKMQIRNEWMIRSCTNVLAVWNGTSGGTHNCLSYAFQTKKPVSFVPLPKEIIAAGAADSVVPVYQHKTQAPNAPHEPTEAISLLKTKRLLDL